MRSFLTNSLVVSVATLAMGSASLANTVQVAPRAGGANAATAAARAAEQTRLSVTRSLRTASVADVGGSIAANLSAAIIAGGTTATAAKSVLAALQNPNSDRRALIAALGQPDVNVAEVAKSININRAAVENDSDLASFLSRAKNDSALIEIAQKLQAAGRSTQAENLFLAEAHANKRGKTIKGSKFFKLAKMDTSAIETAVSIVTAEQITTPASANDNARFQAGVSALAAARKIAAEQAANDLRSLTEGMQKECTAENQHTCQGDCEIISM